MDTITRVMSRMVYNINLMDLPLERSVGPRRNPRRPTTRPANGSDMNSATSGSHSTSDAFDGAPNNHAQRPSMGRKRSNSGESSHLGARRTKSGKLVRSSSDSRLLVELWRNKRRAEILSSHTRSVSFKMSKSLECLNRRLESPCFSDSSVSHSRSPSPTPSSGIDTSSLKDSPLVLDGGSLNSGAPNNVGKCVIAGGTYRGWAPDSAVILWRRMLGILGDVNELTNPFIHGQVLECLGKIVEDLIKVRDNLGIDDSPVSSASLLVPPINFCSPWLFKALTLDTKYKTGKLIAYRTLCLIALRQHDVPPFPDFLCHFYRSIHAGLISRDLEVTSTIIRHCGGKFFSMGLPGSTCLLNPLLDAANLIVTSESKTVL